jgi:hypothetical protein
MQRIMQPKLGLIYKIVSIQRCCNRIAAQALLHVWAVYKPAMKIILLPAVFLAMLEAHCHKLLNFLLMWWWDLNL